MTTPHAPTLPAPDARLAQRTAQLAQLPVFFVGGAVKSGTTWLQLLLDAHPELSCRGEGHIATALLPLLQGALTQYNQRIAGFNQVLFHETDGFPTVTPPILRHVVRTTVLALLSEAAPESLTALRAIGEKCPSNVHHMGSLSALVPGCHLIHIVRDGRDCAVSNWHQQRRIDPGFLTEHFADDFGRYAAWFAKEWVSVNEAGLQFAARNPGRAVRVSYEALHQDAATALTPVLAHLGVRDDTATVAACVEAASFQRLSRGRARGDTTPSTATGSHFRRGITGEWRETFTAPAHAAFWKTAGPLLTRLGYPAT